MISEAPEHRVKGGRVSHSWCMCEVSHGYAGFGVGRVEVDGMHADKARWLVACHSLVRGDTLMTPDHTTFQVRSFG